MIDKRVKSEALDVQQELAIDGVDIELILEPLPLESNEPGIRLILTRAEDAFAFMTIDVTDRPMKDEDAFTYTVFTNSGGYRSFFERGARARLILHVQNELSYKQIHSLLAVVDDDF